MSPAVLAPGDGGPLGANGEELVGEALGTRTMTAAATGSHTPLQRVRLSGALLVAGSLVFVTSLIAFLDKPSPAWFLYLVPVIAGALAYDIPGGIVASLLGAIGCMLVVPSPLLETFWPELATGFVVFTACGAVVGFQAHRQRSHATALERASVLEPVTGTLKAEHLDTQLAREVRRAERYGHALGLALVRVEDFDGFTRIFGHYKADLMLAHLTSVIRLAARSTDIIGHTGSATFAVVLPQDRLDEKTIVRTRLGIQRYARDIGLSIAVLVCVLLVFVAVLLW